MKKLLGILLMGAAMLVRAEDSGSAVLDRMRAIAEHANMCVYSIC